MQFPRLDLVEEALSLMKPATIRKLARTVLVACQHLHPTTGSLFQALIERGLRPDSIFVMGKVYSTNPAVAEGLRSLGCTVVAGSEPIFPGTFRETAGEDARKLWKFVAASNLCRSASSVVILDDGAHLWAGLDQLPARLLPERSRMVAIEQTTGGMFYHTDGLRPPVINVASSAAKRHFETPLIVLDIYKALIRRKIITNRARRIGIIGYGKIGSTLCALLRRRGYNVLVHDPDGIRIGDLVEHSENTLQALIERCDVIVGCTGRDTLRDNIRQLHWVGEKSFASCSSGDIEFASLFKYARQTRPVADGSDGSCCPDLSGLIHPCSKFICFRSGYPINFYNTREYLAPGLIQLTRALNATAVCQAVADDSFFASSSTRSIMLSPVIQAILLTRWFSLDNRRIPSVFSEVWCEAESQGYWPNLSF